MPRLSSCLVASLSLLAGFVLLPGCSTHRPAGSVVKMELTREIVLVPPEIRRVTVTPRGEIDTWQDSPTFHVVLEGDPGLSAVVAVPLLHREIPLEEGPAGTYHGTVTVPAKTTGDLALRATLRHEETGAENTKEVQGVVRLVARRPPPPPPSEPREPVCTTEKRQALERELAQVVPHFAFASADLNEGTRQLLARAADILRKYEPCKIYVLGFTDLQGPDDVNNTLSVMRAQEVRSHLVALGVSPSRMEIKGYGRRFPLTQEQTITAHRRNRRVELHATDPYAGK